MDAPLLRFPVVQQPVWPLPFAFTQPRNGYRFGVENLALRALIDDLALPDALVDLGAGAGILGLLARHLLGPACRPDGAWLPLTLVERQPDHVALCHHHAHEDARATGDAGVRVHDGDLRDLPIWSDAAGAPPPQRPLVLLNPPFFTPGQGRESKEETTRYATHAHHGGLEEFVATAARLAGTHGNIALIWPSEDVASACLSMARHGLVPRRFVWIDARHTGRPYRVWVLAGRTPQVLEQRHCCAWTDR